MKTVFLVLFFTTISTSFLWVALVAIHRKKIEEIDAIALGPDYKEVWAPLYLLRSIQYGFGVMSKTLAARHRPQVDCSKVAPETLRSVRTASIVFLISAVSMFGTIAVQQIIEFRAAG